MPNLILSDFAQRHPHEILWPDLSRPVQRLPLYMDAVQAGFPSPAADYVENLLDLNEHMIQDAPGTFMVRVKGNSMTGAGIYPGDILVVERALPASSGDIVVAEVDGAFTVKELRRSAGQVALVAHNRAFPPIVLKDGQELIIFGVVTGVVRKLRR